MSVKKTPQGTYRARIRDRHGRQVGKTFKLKGDAEAWERNQLIARDNGQTPSVASKITVDEFADIWLAGARQLSDTSVQTYRKALRLYISPVLGSAPISRLTQSDIEAFLTGETEAGLAASTVHRHYRTLHRLCEVAIQRNLISTNPCQYVDPPRADNRAMRFLTSDQVDAVAAAMNPRYGRTVLVSAWAGLRWGEMQALRPEHFDGDALIIIEQLDGGRLKTNASKRRVVLPPSVAAELTDHIATYPGEYVFTTSSGRPLAHSSFAGNVWKPALVAAGVDRDTRWHDLRHTCAALAIQSGAHPKMVADMLGHSSIRVTMDRYGHLFPAMHIEVAAGMDALRKGQNTATT